MSPSELDKLIRDSYANYVIQTAVCSLLAEGYKLLTIYQLDYADAATRHQLVESIRPLLPAIRMTPYGRRIQSKIAAPIASYGSNNNNAPRLPPSTPTRNVNYNNGAQARPSPPVQQYSAPNFRSADLGPAFTFA